MIDDPGRPFGADPGELTGDELEHDAPPILEAEPVDPDAWDAARAVSVLRAGGSVANGLFGAGSPTAFTFTDAELRALDVPLANMLNRVPVTRAAAVVADPIAVGMVLTGYLSRSMAERRAMLEPEPDPALEAERARADAFAFRPDLFGGVA